jgi:hypothetical protein
MSALLRDINGQYPSQMDVLYFEALWGSLRFFYLYLTRAKLLILCCIIHSVFKAQCGMKSAERTEARSQNPDALFSH